MTCTAEVGLKCTYKKNKDKAEKTVLKIDHLEIPRGKLIILLGNSGAGKTTLLEILGLMKHIPDNDSQILFYPENESDLKHNYQELWHNEEKLSSVRRDHFSFIFQQVNLLPQFYIDENIYLTQIIQGKDINKAREKTYGQMQDLGIGAQANKTFPQQLSGGQQQRAAFARAVTPDFTILFGDEPTGNLGEKDAEKILAEISSRIDENHTAIIVTHNYQLALDYGDQIIVIQDNGIVNKDNIFNSTGKNKARKWDTLQKSKNKHNKKQNPKNILKSIMEEGRKKNQVSKNKKAKNIAKPEQVQGNKSESEFKEFTKLFSKKVGKELSVCAKNTAILVSILIFVFCAIGFGTGSLNYLKEKMDDPFINWIDIDIPPAQVHEIPVILDSLNHFNNRTAYQIKNVNGYNYYALYVCHQIKKEEYIGFGRTINVDDPVLGKIGAQDNLLKGRLFKIASDVGLIVTQNFLKKFGYNENTGFIYTTFPMKNNVDWNIPLPIIGVVRDLPGKCDFVSTPYFYDQRFIDVSNPYNPQKTKQLLLFVEGDENHAYSFIDALTGFFNNHAAKYGNQDPFIVQSPQAYDDSYKTGFIVTTDFTTPLNIFKLDTLFNDINSFKKTNLFSPVLLYDNRYGNMLPSSKYDKFAINVSSLDKVGELRSFMNKLKLNIDMARIEALKNYNFITRLTHTLSFFLIIISIGSVCIFIAYILYLHLYKMRVYIGSFKAFGVPNNVLNSIYLLKMLKFVIVAISISFSISAIIGYSGIFRRLLSIIYKLESGYHYFDLFNFTCLIFILLALFFSTIILKISSNMILKHSPGDLIYDRIDLT